MTNFGPKSIERMNKQSCLGLRNKQSCLELRNKPSQPGHLWIKKKWGC